MGGNRSLDDAAMTKPKINIIEGGRRVARATAVIYWLLALIPIYFTAEQASHSYGLLYTIDTAGAGQVEPCILKIKGDSRADAYAALDKEIALGIALIAFIGLALLLRGARWVLKGFIPNPI